LRFVIRLAGDPRFGEGCGDRFDYVSQAFNTKVFLALGRDRLLNLSFQFDVVGGRIQFLPE